MQQTRIGLIGGGNATETAMEQAYRVGQLLAQRGIVLVCGGLGGVMEAGSRGCNEAGGTVLGILPGDSARDANPYVTLPVVTDMGHARNVIIAQTGQAFIAVDGEYGTLSEIAVALKLGKTVVCLDGWEEVPGVLCAGSPEEAVALAVTEIEEG